MANIKLGMNINTLKFLKPRNLTDDAISLCERNCTVLYMYSSYMHSLSI